MAHPPTFTSHSAADVASQMASYPPVTLGERLWVEAVDAGFLRHLWTNDGVVANDVFRSNHPGERRLRSYAHRGIKAVLNLRGNLKHPQQRIEAALCSELGMEFHSVPMSARKPPRKEALIALLHKFDTLPRPFLMHCKSGADRAGLASALYLIDQEGLSVAQARRELSFRYLHIKRSATGVMDHILDMIEAADLPLREWAAQTYSRETATASYERSK